MDFAGLLAAGDLLVRAKLGGTITYSPGVGSPVDVVGIFDAAYVNVASGQGEVSTVGPAVFLALADLPSDPTTDDLATVTINGVQYRPHETKPDGQGTVVLMLHRV